MDKGLLIDKNIDFIIASYGGVGTSFLAKEIAKYAKVNDFEDNDGYKHLPLPPLSLNKNLKIVYVVGDPILATISLFRRDYASYQSFKLNRFSKNELLCNTITLEAYAAQKIDKFNFKWVFNNWDTKFQYYPTLIVKYSAIHNSLFEIKEFLNLPVDFIANFPTKIERQSRTDELSTECKHNLNLMYGDFSKHVSNFPGCYERPKQNLSKLFSIIFSPFFIKAYFLSCYGILKQYLKALIKKD